VDPTSPAAESLSTGDLVLFLQSRDCKHLSLQEAQEILQEANRHIDIIVAKVDRPGTPIRLPTLPPELVQNTDKPGTNEKETKDDSWWIQEAMETLVKPSERKLTSPYRTRCRSTELEEPLKYECAKTMGGNELDHSWWTPRSKTPMNGVHMREERGRSGKRALWRFHSTYEEINYEDGEYSKSLSEEIRYPSERVPQSWTSLPRKLRHKDNEAFNILHDSKRGWRYGRSAASSPVAVFRNKISAQYASEPKLNEPYASEPKLNDRYASESKTSEKYEMESKMNKQNAIEAKLNVMESELKEQCAVDCKRNGQFTEHKLNNLSGKKYDRSDENHRQVWKDDFSKSHRQDYLIDLHTEIDPRYPWRKKRIADTHGDKGQNLPRVDKNRRSERRPPDPPVRISSIYGLEVNVPPEPPKRFSNLQKTWTSEEPWMPEHQVVTARMAHVDEAGSEDDNTSEKSFPEMMVVRVGRELFDSR